MRAGGVAADVALTWPSLTTARTGWGRTCRRSTPGRHWGGRGGGTKWGACVREEGGGLALLRKGERACPGRACRPPTAPSPPAARPPRLLSLLLRIGRRCRRPGFRHVDTEFAGHVEVGRGAAAGIALDDAAVGSGQRGGLDGEQPGRALERNAIGGRGGGRRGRGQAGPASRLDGGGLGAARAVVGDATVHAGRALGRAWAGGRGGRERRGRGREKGAREISWFGGEGRASRPRGSGSAGASADDASLTLPGPRSQGAGRAGRGCSASARSLAPLPPPPPQRTPPSTPGLFLSFPFSFSLSLSLARERTWGAGLYSPAGHVMTHSPFVAAVLVSVTNG